MGERRTVRAAGWELLLIAVLYVLYSLSRHVTAGSAAAALANAQDVLRLQVLLRMPSERWLNESLSAHPALAVPATYFYATLHYVVTPWVLAWVWRRHRHGYSRARAALVGMTVVGVVGFMLFPLAPPRMLPHFVDTMAAFSDYGWWGAAASAPRGLGHLTNQYAAMPSLHVGWAVWSGWLVARHARRRSVRALAVAYPVLTVVVVVGTGNHYVVDVLAGVAVAALAILFVDGVARARRSSSCDRREGRAGRGQLRS